jgi:hypothetical protein
VKSLSNEARHLRASHRGIARGRAASLVTLSLAVFLGCGGDGVSPPSKGSLAISVAGVPTGAGASISVSGPGGYSHTLSGGATLKGLIPGSYTISAAQITVAALPYAGAPASQTVDVAAGATPASVAVVYTLVTGSLALEITGLPAGANAGVTVTGPTGFTRAVTSSGALGGLVPGTYTVTAADVTVGADAYAATPTSQSVTVAASLTSSPLTITYQVTTGKLALVVSGLPQGASGAISITGPAGYSSAATSTHTFTGLKPGTYTVAASSVVDGTDHYAPNPASQAVNVPASAAASTANVSYVAAAATLTVSVSGLPGALPASIIVNGPGGFQQDVTASVTIPNLVKGTYSIAAQSVTQGSTTYQPSATLQTVTLASGGSGTASVAYTGTTGALNLVIDGFYLVQAVQTYTSLVPLVANRNALIRVFARATTTNSATPSVRVRVYNGATLVKTVTIAAGGSSVPQAIDEGQLSASWNALIEGEWLQPGASVLVDVDPSNLIAEASESDNVYPSSGSPLTLDVRTVPPVSLELVPVMQAANGFTGNVTAGNQNQFISTLRKIYPLGALDANVHSTYTTNAPVLQNNDGNSAWDQILNEMSALRATEGSTAYYYGVVKTSYSSGIAGLGFVPGHAAVGWDALPSGTNVLAHELGHNFSLFHAPCGGAGGPDPLYPYSGGLAGVYGYDMVAGLVKLPTQPDLMGYCSNSWISDYHYTRVLDYRSSNPSIATATAPVRPGLLVWGRIENGAPVLEPAYEVTAPPSLPARQGTHRLELLGDRGERITELVFEGDRIADSRNPDARTFAFVIPADALAGHTLASLRLRSPGGEAELRDDVLPSGGRRPLVRDASEEPQATGAGRGMVRLRWAASAVRGVLVRDPRTGEVLTFGRGGEALVRSPSRELDVLMSNGVRTERRRVIVR